MNRKTLLAAAGALGTLVGIVILDTAGIGGDDMPCCEPMLTSALAVNAGEAGSGEPGAVAQGPVHVDGAPLARFPSLTVTGTRRIVPRGPDRDDEPDPADAGDAAARTAEELAAYQRDHHVEADAALRWQGP